jgi:hypothetical protein
MTAAAKPGQCEGGGSLDCRARDLVLMEGGATRAAAVATWALVCTRGDVLIGVAALRSRTARRFLRHSHLVESVGMLVGLLVGAPLLSTLGTGVCVSMECVILLLSLIWGVGTLGGGCPLLTRCVWGLAEVLRCLQSVQVVPECWLVWRQ